MQTANLPMVRRQPGALLPAGSTPTITLSAAGAGTGLSGTVTDLNAYDSTTGTIRDRFRVVGNGVIRAGTTSPNDIAVRGRYPTTTSSNGNLVVETSIFTADFELRIVGQGGALRVIIDGVEVLLATQALHAGTAQGGSSSTITLATGASTVNDFYNTDRYVYTTGGTGSGQVRQIIDYVGSTRVATVYPAWTVAPDATTTYRTTRSNVSPIDLPSADGSLYRVRFTFPDGMRLRQVRVEFTGQQFQGVTIGPNDGFLSTPAQSGPPMYCIGDSFVEPTGSNTAYQGIASIAAELLGWEPWLLGVGSTGFVADGSTGRLNFVDRCVPAVNSWVATVTGSSGTWSVTQDGITASGIAYNASEATIQTAIDSAFGSGAFHVRKNGTSIYLLGRSLGDSTAIMTAAGTGGATASAAQWLGDLANCAVRDPATNAVMPGYVVIAGGYNDVSEDPEEVADAYETMVTRIGSRFPMLIVLTVGPWPIGSNNPAGWTGIQSALVARAAEVLPQIYGVTPHIDPTGWIGGTGNQGAPSATGNASIYIGPDSVHPTQNGHNYLGTRLAYVLAGFLGYR